MSRVIRLGMAMAAQAGKYMGGIRFGIRSAAEISAQRSRPAAPRLSYQIVAELIMNKKNLPGFTEWYEDFANVFRLDLRTLQRNGEISLPLGLQQTVQAHINLYHGTIYATMANHDADADALVKCLKSSLALTAGATQPSTAIKQTG